MQPTSALERLFKDQLQAFVELAARQVEALQADTPVTSTNRASIDAMAIARSHGSKVWDAAGNQYVDLVNDCGAILFGHDSDFAREALARGLENGSEIGRNAQALLCELTGNERAIFYGSSSEALAAATRLARAATGRMHVLPYEVAASLDFIRARAGQFAAIVLEPRSPDVLREIRAITEQSQTFLILDEQVTGFRTHPGGVQALFGVRGDLAIYGNGAAAGLPIGVLAGKAKFLDALDAGQSHRAGEPEFVMAVCWAVLRRLKEAGPQLQEELSEKTERLVRALNELFEAAAVPARAEHFRSILHLRGANLLYPCLRKHGIHIREGSPCFLTTAHSAADLDHIVEGFRETIADLQSEGLLPAAAGVLDDVPAVRAEVSPVASPLRLDPEPVMETVPAADPRVEVRSVAAASSELEPSALELQDPETEAVLSSDVQEVGISPARSLPVEVLSTTELPVEAVELPQPATETVPSIDAQEVGVSPARSLPVEVLSTTELPVEAVELPQPETATVPSSDAQEVGISPARSLPVEELSTTKPPVEAVEPPQPATETVPSSDVQEGEISAGSLPVEALSIAVAASELKPSVVELREPKTEAALSSSNAHEGEISPAASLPPEMLSIGAAATELPPSVSVPVAEPLALPLTEAQARPSAQMTLAAIFQEVLDTTEVGLDDDILSLGADSIQLLRIAGRAHGIGMPVTPQMLLKHHTARELAVHLTNAPQIPRKPIVAKPRDAFRLRQAV